jgi:hypothetical protein
MDGWPGGTINLAASEGDSISFPFVSTALPLF